MLQRLPEKNNFYAFFMCVDKARVAEVFSSNGWQLRKSSWTDFELTNDWSELILEGEEKEPLMNDAIIYDKVNIDKLDAVLITLEGQIRKRKFDCVTTWWLTSAAASQDIW
jgi:hypothetical protein